MSSWAVGSVMPVANVSGCPSSLQDLSRTEEGVECSLDIPIARIQDNFDHSSIDAWKGLPERVLRLLSRAQRPGWLWRGSWGCLGGSLLGWRGIARCSIRVLWFIIEVQRSCCGRRLGAGAVGCRSRGLTRSRL